MANASPSSLESSSPDPSADSIAEAKECGGGDSLLPNVQSQEPNRAVAYLRSAIQDGHGSKSKSESRGPGFLRFRRRAESAAAVRTSLALNTPGLTEPDLSLFSAVYTPAFTAETEAQREPAETSQAEPVEAVFAGAAPEENIEPEFAQNGESDAGRAAERPASLLGEVLPPELCGASEQVCSADSARVITMQPGVRQPASETGVNEPA
jgi:hypothetical protein